MLTFFIAVLAIMLPIILGLILAFATARFDKAVVENRETIEQQDKLYNPSLTLGHKLKIQADPEEQFVEARRLARPEPPPRHVGPICVSAVKGPRTWLRPMTG
jgi:hypothetical protein